MYRDYAPSALCFLAFLMILLAIWFRHAPRSQESHQRGLWIVRNKDGVILSASPDYPQFKDFFGNEIKGAHSYGIEWDIKQTEK